MTVANHSGIPGLGRVAAAVLHGLVRIGAGLGWRTWAHLIVIVVLIAIKHSGVAY